MWWWVDLHGVAEARPAQVATMAVTVENSILKSGICAWIVEVFSAIVLIVQN
jgi:hypothetical protein